MKYIPTAWMLRDDGVAIPCVQHIYADVKEVDETLYAAEWLYQNTANPDTQRIALEFIISYGMQLNKNTPVEAIKKDIQSKPYIFLTEKFVDSVSDELLSSKCGNVLELAKCVEIRLNSEFTRTRYGGMYNTVCDTTDLYFRISTDDFEWIKILKSFIRKFDALIETVTIVRDEESTGDINTFYRTKSGITIDKMPLNDFMTAEISTI